jgi:DNA-binding response OmpR family regulator/HPt (histidine-containing phosphotransfer) domain-containing protein
MMKILIIEDDPIIANIYRSRLDKEGFQVEIAADGQTGFYRIHESHPDALLLDLMLPKMDGLQILRKIRAQKAFATLPVIVFTNAYVPNMINEANKAGANVVFNKAALTPRQIIDALNSTLFPNAPVDQPTPAPSAAPVTAPAVPVSQVETVQPRRDAIPEPPTEANKPSSAELDAAFQKDLLGSFIQSAPDTLAALRKLLHEFLRSSTDQIRLAQLLEMYRKVHSITGNAAVVGLDNIAQMCSAFEALLKELSEKPKNISPSCMRTIAHAVDFIGVLFERGTGPSVLGHPPVEILVVDDEIISRRAIIYALDKAQLKSEGIEDPLVAYELLGQKSFDLIILDVDMPGMNGFELCTKLRSLPLSQSTPVIFVTSMTDFESRARSSLSGGNDLIAKPFFFIELTVKALIYVLKGRIAPPQKQVGSTMAF